MKKRSRIRGVEPRASEEPDTFLGKREMRVTDVTATPYPMRGNGFRVIDVQRRWSVALCCAVEADGVGFGRGGRQCLSRSKHTVCCGSRIVVRPSHLFTSGAGCET